MKAQHQLPLGKEELRPRPGLSSRDIVAFVEAWSRGTSAGPLVDYLGWESGFHDATDARGVAMRDSRDDHGGHVRAAR